MKKIEENNTLVFIVDKRANKPQVCYGDFDGLLAESPTLARLIGPHNSSHVLYAWLASFTHSSSLCLLLRRPAVRSSRP